MQGLVCEEIRAATRCGWKSCSTCLQCSPAQQSGSGSQEWVQAGQSDTCTQQNTDGQPPKNSPAASKSVCACCETAYVKKTSDTGTCKTDVTRAQCLEYRQWTAYRWSDPIGYGGSETFDVNLPSQAHGCRVTHGQTGVN